MPVPTAITDLSTTASSNSPSGSETPADGDNYLRAHAAFIAQLHANKLNAAGGTVRLADGSATSPSGSFTNEPDCGLYLAGTNQVGVATNGVSRVVVSGTGQTVRINAVGAGAEGIAIYQADETGDTWAFSTKNTSAADATQFALLHDGANLLLGNARDGDVTIFRNSVAKLTIGTSGIVAPDSVSALSFITTSDERLKTNIEDAPDAGTYIDAIRVVSFDWNAGGHVPWGLVAQELDNVVPSAVHKGTRWGIDYVQPMAMLLLEVQSLRRRVAELEGNQ